MTPAALIDRLEAAGVTLWVDGATLRYRAPSGVLAPAHLAALRAHKAAVMAALAEPAGAAAPATCGACGHYRPGITSHRGNCAAGVTLAAPLPASLRGDTLRPGEKRDDVAGFGVPELWHSTPRECASYLPRDVAEGIEAMAERWQYTPDDLAWAVEQAAADPDGWRTLIEADLQGRRWPGGDGGQD